MASRRENRVVDAAVDMHGLNAEEMRRSLHDLWPSWRGLRSVRIITGQGVVLKPEAEQWCREMGIPFLPDPRNPGALRIFPGERSIPDVHLTTTLRDKGLRHAADAHAFLSDSAPAVRARLETERRKAEEQQTISTDADRAAQEKRDETLWSAEIARLESQDRAKSGDRSTEKPGPPRILPPSEIKHQEGFWRAELVRVAGSDEQTLTKQKRTGLDKLAPPIEPKPARPAPADKPKAPARESQADHALFEAEMDRLAGADPSLTLDRDRRRK